ncbi:MAG TPA: dTMP kinase [Candidatus Methanoculleus thermohydrogenotrophicum]|nr:dTMP kinase [Candidatus Methanoculleus thermohydrogenotrophicum]NLM82613.1 dTMP kinase [Candidatus Methanoculleus thermohydrogenotrophicum]HOB18249.1 dTMP kinase [Candidatus Methanoculleus thermohydrogenotrophicum]HPZ38372.1 dTMP kinase [Candidatus Methanoculleus thermohydrogenotrophicum]HQC91600.1 dTMP kinase [Candidatus Methanoculleus thermohydrogenotrophicum]
MLITIEGIDGSGKSTLIARLRELLADLDPLLTREPGATWVGDAVRRAVAERMDPITEALLFCADHAAHIDTLIRPALDAGRLVISDRYSDSRFAYQPVVLDGVLPDPLLWLRQIHAGWSIRPDLTFLLVLPVEDAVERLDPVEKREYFENPRILSRVQENYLALAGSDPARFIIVDALHEKEEVARFVADEIRSSVRSSRRRHRA